MARSYRMTPARRAALRKAQQASARKRKGTGKAVRTHLKKHRRKYVAGGVAIGTLVAANAAGHRQINKDIKTKGHYTSTGGKSFTQGRKGYLYNVGINRPGPVGAHRIRKSQRKAVRTINKRNRADTAHLRKAKYGRRTKVRSTRGPGTVRQARAITTGRKVKR